MSVDRRELERRAARALEARRWDEAMSSLWPLVERARVVDEELRGALRMMTTALGRMGRTRAAATIQLFLGDTQAALTTSDDPRDRARVAVERRDHARAAREFEAAGFPGHAALQLEIAGNHTGARVLWERLGSDPRLRDDPYTAGLVRFNTARAAARLGDRDAARKATIHCMHLLAAAADAFEAQGLRERAFDCWNVVLEIGKEGRFENLAEGYVNSTRILREDGLWRYALRYYEDFQSLAIERGEHHAAATVLREAADYCRRSGLVYGRDYRLRGAEAHGMAADALLSSGAPPEMAENALSAALDAYNELGMHARVRATYLRLSSLELSEKRKARYARLAERLAGVSDEAVRLDRFVHERETQAYPKVWELDVVEWEQAGDAAETMGEVMLDDRQQESIRVAAMLARVWQLQSPDLDTGTLVGLGSRLGLVDIYVTLAPIEKLARHDDAQVRVAAMKAVTRLYFKRSFVTITAGLADDVPEVRREALAAVKKFHFRHAFDPLSRIWRSARDPEVRKEALTSIGKVPAAEAIELLLDVLRHGDPPEKAIARDALVRADIPEALDLVRRAAANETGAARKELDQLLRARGVAS